MSVGDAGRIHDELYDNLHMRSEAFDRSRRIRWRGPAGGLSVRVSARPTAELNAGICNRGNGINSGLTVD